MMSKGDMRDHEIAEEQLVSAAIADGYPDVTERCRRCAAVFRNYHHFVRCGHTACPMKGKDAKSFLDLWEEMA